MADHRRPYLTELLILEFLLERGASDTRRISRHFHGAANARKHSQLTRQTLLAMQRQGWVKPADNGTPVIWQRTDAGMDALRSATGDR